MCEAVTGISMATWATIASVASAAASTAMAIKAQNDQADAEADAAKKAAASDYVQQTEQQDQVNSQAALEKTERARQAMIERAKLRVAEGESGVSGLSPFREMGETYFNEGYDASILETNRANKIRQIQTEKDATESRAAGRINVANSRLVPGWAAGLQIGSSALQAGTSTYSATRGWK